MGKTPPTITNVKKAHLIANGYKSFEEWDANPSNLYIGRNMEVYIKGAKASKWGNPYNVKKYGLDSCLDLYEKHVKTGDLYNQLAELEGKTLGCWCYPNKCHGNILIKLFNEVFNN